MTNQKDMGYGWFTKARFEAKKALKEQKPHRGTAAWGAYWEDVRKGTVKKLSYPVLLTSSGPFTSPEKVQEITGLPSLPEVVSSTRASHMDRGPPAKPKEEDKVRYCAVDSLSSIRDPTYGQNVLIWFQGNHLGAWLAYSLKADNRQWEDFRIACRKGALLDTTYAIIISSSGPFTSPEKIQEVLGLSAPLEVKESSRTTLSMPVQLAENAEEKVQYCDIDLKYLDKIEEYSEGEDIVIWVEFKHRCAWLAHSVKPKVGDQGIKAGDGEEVN